MGWVERLSAVDSRIIYAVMGLSVLLPILVPIPLKVTVTEPTRNAFAAVEALQPGSRILLSFDYGPSTAPENDPMATALLRHCMVRGIRVIAIALFPVGGGSMSLQRTQEIGADFPDKKDGTDYVNLGYKDGGQAAMKKMGADFPGVFPVDAAGHPIASLPIMEGVKSYSDFALGVTLSTGIIGEWWPNLVNAQFHLPIIIGPTAVSAPKFYAYLNAKQAVGLIGGLKGASEYEKLLVDQYPDLAPMYVRPGGYTATKGMGAQNLAHIVIIAFIILGNAFFIVQRRRTRMRSGEGAP